MREPRDAVGEPRLAAAKHQRMKPSPSGPNALPGARPSLASRTSCLAVREAVGEPATRKNTYIAPGGGATSILGGAQAPAPASRAPPRARKRVRDRRFAVGDGGHARALDEDRRARRVVLDQLAEIRHQRGRRDDPAQPEAGHQPRLGEAVGADHAIVGVREVEKRRRARRAPS